MKSIIYLPVVLLTMLGNNLSAQEEYSREYYGNTLNAGIGFGYYGYMTYPAPVIHADFEFDVAGSFTLAPFVTCYTYHSEYYWGAPEYPYRYYSYRQTAIPIGVKGTYYFDRLFNANPKWDFYTAGSLGATIIRTRWEDGYYGDRRIYRRTYRGTSPLYLDLHIGSEYHLNDRAGIFLDLSTGISTFGFGFHF